MLKMYIKILNVIRSLCEKLDLDSTSVLPAGRVFGSDWSTKSFFTVVVFENFLSKTKNSD